MLLEVICGIVRYIATFVKAQGIIMSAIALTAAVTFRDRRGYESWSAVGDPGGDSGCAAFYRHGGGAGAAGNLAAIGEESFGRALICGALYVVCIFLREILEPRLIGRKIGVSPIAVLVSLYAGIRLFRRLGDHQGTVGICADLRDVS